MSRRAGTRTRGCLRSSPGIRSGGSWGIGQTQGIDIDVPPAADPAARDSLLATLVTLGEGYHNYHHRFPGDYRNGVRFYHYDPTRWCIWLLSRIGLTRDLKRAPAELVLRTRQALRARTAPTVS